MSRPVPENRRWVAACLAFLAAVPLALFWPALFQGRMIYGYDFLATHAPFWAEVQRSLAAHQWPLWMPDLYGGMPGIAACNLLFAYPTHFLGDLAGLPLAVLLAWDAALHVALAGVGLFLFLRRLDRSLGAALLGAFFFQLSGSLVSQLNGGYLIYVEGIALLPWVFWAAHKGWQENTWWAWGLCGLFLGLQILAGAAQIFAYTFAAVALFAWALPGAEARLDGRRARRGPVLKGLGLALGLASLVAAPQLWLTLQYLPLAQRHGYSLPEFIDGSISLREALVWLVPGYFGWQEPTYAGAMGDCFTSEYLGLLPWILAAAGLAAAWGREWRLRWMVGLALAALFLAQRHWTPFYYLFRHLPILDGFRIWSRILFLLAFAVCVLAAYGWDELRQGKQRRRARAAAAIFTASAAGVAALAWARAGDRPLADAAVMHGFSNGMAPGPLTAYLSAMARDSAAAALWALPLALGVAWLAYRKPSSAWIVVLALAFHAWGQAPMLTRFVRYIDPAMAFPRPLFAGPPLPPPVVEPQRVLDNVYYSNRALALGYEGLGGIESMLMRSSVRLRDAMAGRRQEWLDLLNMRYELVRQNGPGEPVYKVYENRAAYPRAWLVTRSRGVADDAAAYRLLGDPRFDPRREVLLARDPGLKGPPPRGSVQWLQRKPQSERLAVDTGQPAALMISNAWYPSWRARVDGVAQPVLKADGGLQAVLLAPGRHEVEVYVDPSLFYDALAACLAGLLGLLGLGLLKGGPGPAVTEREPAGRRPPP